MEYRTDPELNKQYTEFCNDYNTKHYKTLLDGNLFEFASTRQQQFNESVQTKFLKTKQNAI